MMFGQIIGVTFPIVLALNFVFGSQGLKGFGCKINIIVNVLFTFLTIVMPLFYLKYLVTARKDKIRHSE